MHIFAECEYNCTPLAPPGKRVVINNRPNNIVSWAPHGEEVCYILLAMEHYIYHKSYIPKTIVEKSQTQ